MQGLNSMGNREKNGNAAVSDLHATPLEQHYPRSETLTRPHHLHSWKTKLREHLSPWLPSGRRESLWTRPPRPPTPKGHRTQVPVHTTSYPHLQIPPSAKRGQAVSWLLVWSAKTDTQQRQRQRQTQSSAAAACRLRQDCNTTMGNGGERGKGGKATRQWCGRSKWWGWGGEWETAWKECDFLCKAKYQWTLRSTMLLSAVWYERRTKAASVQEAADGTCSYFFLWTVKIWTDIPFFFLNHGFHSVLSSLCEGKKTDG